MPHNARRPGAALNVQGCPGGSETLAGISDSQTNNRDSSRQEKSETQFRSRLCAVPLIKFYWPDAFL
jgi:hypothetical protein